MYDIVIIGAGITGTMLARDLSRYALKIAVLDKENDIADGATMANSAIVHTGYDPEDGTLKAQLNVRGARLYPRICRDLGCKYEMIGAFVVAVNEEEEKHLDVLADRARRRGIPYEWLSGNQVRQQEPNVSPQVTKALSFPTTAVIYPWEVAIACMEVAVGNGVKLFLNHAVTDIDRLPSGYRIHCGSEVLETRFVINAAGVEADEIARMVTADPGFDIRPRKGEYFVIDNNVHFARHVIFPTPSAKGKGVLVVPTVYGNTLIGPNSQFVPSTTDTGSTTEGLNDVRTAIQKTMKFVPFSASIRNFAGLRPSSTNADFIIEEVKDAPQFINCASIESPGLASAPAIAEYVIDHILKDKISLMENPHAVMTRPRPMVMKELSDEEKAEKIRENPAYGRIICRCEEVSEGEIVDCIHRPCGARTVKGVKKRVRPGMGRCQGGFCEPRVLAILARELGVDPTEIVLDGPGSYILKQENR